MDWARSRPRPAMDWAAMDWARNGLGGNGRRNGLGPQWTGHRLPVTRVSLQPLRPLDCG